MRGADALKKHTLDPTALSFAAGGLAHDHGSTYRITGCKDATAWPNSSLEKHSKMYDMYIYKNVAPFL